MALIKDALSVLPAKPVVVAAPVIVIVVLSLYYWDLRDRCVDIRQARESLYQQLISVPTGSRFRLADFTGFDWNQVRIVASVVPDTMHDECHFGWNWPAGERASLIEAGQLSALIFGNRGRVVGYYELRRDRVAFDEIDAQLTPATAVFDVDRVPADDRIVSLSLAPQVD